MPSCKRANLIATTSMTGVPILQRLSCTYIFYGDLKHIFILIYIKMNVQNCTLLTCLLIYLFSVECLTLNSFSTEMFRNIFGIYFIYPVNQFKMEDQSVWSSEAEAEYFDFYGVLFIYILETCFFFFFNFFLEQFLAVLP